MKSIAVLFLAVLLAPASLASESMARDIAQQFVGQLKPRLVSALQEGGPAHAIEVCAEDAPAIARELSLASGWSVKRVSLKPRNLDAAPDAWERQQLERFDAAVAAGESPGVAIATVEGRFRYMQPQRAGEVCLLCHGETLDPAVAAALERHYPGDLATGYVAGEVRGAISLVAPPP